MYEPWRSCVSKRHGEGVWWTNWECNGILAMNSILRHLGEEDPVRCIVNKTHSCRNSCRTALQRLSENTLRNLHGWRFPGRNYKSVVRPRLRCEILVLLHDVLPPGMAPLQSAVSHGDAHCIPCWLLCEAGIRATWPRLCCEMTWLELCESTFAVRCESLVRGPKLLLFYKQLTQRHNEHQ